MRAGTIVGDRYELTKLIGVGGFGKVWSGLDLQSRDRVAIKVIDRAVDQRLWLTRLIETETDALSQIKNPLVVQLHQTILDDDRTILVMEYVDGQTLARAIGQRVETNALFPMDEVRTLFERIARAVAAVHERGILHRDLKPANVMLTAEPPHVKLLDFGVAKIVDSLTSEATTTGRRIGTFSQLAPESIRGEPLDVRVDVFGLGCTLFELLSLRVPWLVGANGHATRTPQGHLLVPATMVWEMVFHRILTGPRPSPAPYNPAVTPAVARIVLKALAIEPEHRFQDVPSMIDALGAAYEGQLIDLPASITEAKDEPTPRFGVAVGSSKRPSAPIVPTDAFGSDDQVEVSIGDLVGTGAAHARTPRDVSPEADTGPDHDTSHTPLEAAMADLAGTTSADLEVSTTPSDPPAALRDPPDSKLLVVPAIVRDDEHSRVGAVEVPRRLHRAPDSVRTNLLQDILSGTRGDMRPPSAPRGAATASELAPSEAVVINLNPAFVAFSAFVSDMEVPRSTSVASPPVVPPLLVEATQPSASLLSGLIAACGVGFAVHPGVGAGAAAASAAAAALDVVARRRRRSEGLARTETLIDLVATTTRCSWSRKLDGTDGMRLIGEPTEASCGPRIELYLPRNSLRPDSYRIGLTIEFRTPSLRQAHVSFAQLVQATNHPAMHLPDKLARAFLHHMERREPSHVDVHPNRARLSVGVHRDQPEDAVDDVVQTVIGASVLLQWLDQCLADGGARSR